MSAATSTPTLSDQDLGELLSLIKGADSVELKLTVPVSDRSQGAAALGVDPLDAQIRQVYFFDTPDLALYKNGLVVRARRVQRKGDDSVVKLRPVVPDELPAELRDSENFGVEVDAMPGGFVCSGSMKRSLGSADVKDAVQRREADSQALLEGTALVVRGPRTRWARDGRPLDTRPDLRAEAEVGAGGIRPQARGRALALSRQLHDHRAVDEVRAVRGVPGCRRDESVPDSARRRPRRRARDQDEEGARVLLGAAAGESA